MARGLEKHHARQSELSLFAKDLVRRCKATCELCGAAHHALTVFEVPPVPAEPDFDRCLMCCDDCLAELAANHLDENHWRSLTQVIWSEIPAVQALAAALLKRLAEDHDWATELLEEAFFDDAVATWSDEIELPHTG